MKWKWRVPGLTGATLQYKSNALSIITITFDMIAAVFSLYLPCLHVIRWFLFSYCRVGMEMRVLLKKQTGGCVYLQREKFVKGKLVKSWFADNIRCRRVSVWLVYLGSIKALSVSSPFTLPYQDNRGPPWLQPPTGFSVDFFFFSFFQSLQQNMSSFVTKYGEGSLERLKNGNSRFLFLFVLRCQTTR